MKIRNSMMIMSAFALLLSMNTIASETETDAADSVVPGVTVCEDPASDTGYTTTFVYENSEASKVALTGNFAFFEPDKRIGAIPSEAVPVEDWVPGDFRANSTDLSADEPMSKIEGTNYWTASLSLPSGHYTYNYRIDGAKESVTDPANPPMKSSAKSGSTAVLSTFDVPYSEKQGEDTINFDFMLQHKDTPAGEITFADYTDVNGNQAPLAIYLPAGYDKNRSEPYPVIYLSHGGGGNELEWFSSGNVNTVFDNMIAKGTVEPTIIVTMNNGVYEWDFDVIDHNVMEHIIPFMEENYNISKESQGRAFAGLSMGSMTTNNMYYKEADKFGYFGMFSGSDASADLSALDQKALKSPVIMLGAGQYDMAYINDTYHTDKAIGTLDILEKLDEAGIDYHFYEVQGGHDWSTWPQLIKIFAEKYLWK